MGVPTYQELVDEVMDVVQDATWDLPAVACQGKLTAAGQVDLGDTVGIHTDSWEVVATRSGSGEITRGADET